MEAADYDHNTDCHPFWHIRRSNCFGEFNSAVVEVEIKVINSTNFNEFQTDEKTSRSLVSDFTVTVPFIRNTEDIEAGKEIVLQWAKKPVAKETDKKPSAINAFSANAPKKMKR